MDNKGYLTVKQAAARACVSPSLVYALLKARRLPAIRVGVRGKGKWLISVSDLDGFMASCKIGNLPVVGEETFTYLK